MTTSASAELRLAQSHRHTHTHTHGHHACLAHGSHLPLLLLREGSSLSHPARAKSYVLKFIRGHIPADLKDLAGTLGCLYGNLPDVDEYAQFVLPRR